MAEHEILADETESLEEDIPEGEELVAVLYDGSLFTATTEPDVPVVAEEGSEEESNSE